MQPSFASADQPSLAGRLKAFGCPELVPLDQPAKDAAQIDYLDLLPQDPTSPITVHAVAEHQGSALLYVLDIDAEENLAPDLVAGLLGRLANRSDPAWLGLARPGSLELHPITFQIPSRLEPGVRLQAADPVAPQFFQSLVHGTFSDTNKIQGSDAVFRRIEKLLGKTVDEYVQPDGAKGKIAALDVLSMAGRALFFRFLVDRKIVRQKELPEICPTARDLKDTFESPAKAASTSAWLDETFNGDFLPLIDETIPASHRELREEAYLTRYRQVENEAGKGFFVNLHAILNGWRPMGRVYQQEFDWADLDFAHIPVGVLSQVYEAFSHRADPKAARRTSVHYTPRNIARMMVDQAFAAAENPAFARVLDPACGAGIFLVLALRRLVAERWRADGKRPDTKLIQSLLYHQLRGFDIGESALRLAALSLYITAIEVNAAPRPPKALKFPRNLRGSVLHNFGDTELGSLGPRVPEAFDNSFDLVIGNPPWTRLREATRQRVLNAGRAKAAPLDGSDALNEAFTAIGRRVLAERGLSELAKSYANPDKNPDLPFLWRSLQWAKKETGIIALAMPARLFGRTTGQGQEAWQAVLRSVSINGLVNGSDLRKSAVWDSMDLPFCLLFARNRLPKEDHRFYYSSPTKEPGPNRLARFRIDYESIRPIRAERLRAQPWILKALSLGTWRDVAILEQILESQPQSLGDDWKSWDPKEERMGKGYVLSINLQQEPMGFLGPLPDFEPTGGFAVDFDRLPTFAERHGRTSAHRPRRERLYQPPLVIVPKALGDDPQTPKAFLARRATAFSQIYYGYSCSSHSDAEALAGLLVLLVHSTLFRYFALMTSVSLGADRMIFTKQDLDRVPFPSLSQLSPEQKAEIARLVRQLEQDEEKPWLPIEHLIFGLYGIDEGSQDTMRDTLFSAAAYRRRGAEAFERTRRDHRQPFLAELQEILEPFFEVCGQRLEISEPPSQPDTWRQPWFFLMLSTAGDQLPFERKLIALAMAEANRQSASRILVRSPDGRGLLLGLLNERRWWTVSRARLCAQHIIRHHLDAFARSIHKNLLPAMLDPSRQARIRAVEPLCLVQAPGEAHGDGDAEPLHVSTHRRDFDWAACKGRATPILVYHSWHRCD